MKTYRLKLVFDFDAVDDAEARKRVQGVLADVQGCLRDGAGPPLRPARANCVQSGDHSGRNILRGGDGLPEGLD